MNLKRVILLFVFSGITYVSTHAIDNVSLSPGVGAGGLFAPRTTHNFETFAQLQFGFGNCTMEPMLGFINRSQEVWYYRRDGNDGFVLLKDYGLFAETTAPHTSKYFSVGVRLEYLWGKFDEATKMELMTYSRIKSSHFQQFTIHLKGNMDIPVTQRLNFRVSGMLGYGDVREYPENGHISDILPFQLNVTVSYKIYIKKKSEE